MPYLKLTRLLLAALFTGVWLLPSAAWSYETLEWTLDNEADMLVTQFEGEGETLLIWLPNQRGFAGGGYIRPSADLAAQGVEVWVAQLHDTYVVPPGRYSLSEMDLDDLLALLRRARDQGFKEIFLKGSSRGMQLALKLAYLWQQQEPTDTRLRGIISMNPHLLQGRPKMGQPADYLTLTRHSNLPVYLIMPQRSTKFARSAEIARQLQTGGSPVYNQYLADTQGGYHMRSDDDLTATDLQQREQLAELLLQAMQRLRWQQPAPFVTATNESFLYAVEQRPLPQSPNLKAYQGDPKPPALQLTDLQGGAWDANSVKDQVVLVNFWASWCGPCVEEIPSLSRLSKRLQDQPFRILAVNIGEPREQVQEFLQKVEVNFDVLLDENSLAVRDWQVYAYPSNFLIDRDGSIRYAYRGALQWDADEVVEVIESLLPGGP